MSALGHKRTSRPEISMSALHPKADIAERDQDVRFVPTADIERCDWMVMWQPKALLGFGSKIDNSWNRS
jgi:hypothetical protein